MIPKYVRRNMVFTRLVLLSDKFIMLVLGCLKEILRTTAFISHFDSAHVVLEPVLIDRLQVVLMRAMFFAELLRDR